MIFGVNQNNEIEVVGDFNRTDLTRVEYNDTLGFFADKEPTDYKIIIIENSVMISPRKGWLERQYARSKIFPVQSSLIEAQNAINSLLGV